MSIEITTIGTPGSGDDFKVADSTTGGGLSDLPPHHRELIDGAYTVTLATHTKAGDIQLSPVWLRAPDDEHVEVNTVKGRSKDQHMRHGRSVAIQIVNPANAYHWLTIYGDVVEVIEESDAERGHLATESIDELAELYLGQRPYPFRKEGEERVAFRIAPTKIVTFGAP
jgi:PPOX class probable F420-dependent enzyme